jgi:hypothetical protein
MNRRTIEQGTEEQRKNEVKRQNSKVKRVNTHCELINASALTLAALVLCGKVLKIAFRS